MHASVVEEAPPLCESPSEDDTGRKRRSCVSRRRSVGSASSSRSSRAGSIVSAPFKRRSTRRQSCVPGDASVLNLGSGMLSDFLVRCQTKLLRRKKEKEPGLRMSTQRKDPFVRDWCKVGQRRRSLFDEFSNRAVKTLMHITIEELNSFDTLKTELLKEQLQSRLMFAITVERKKKGAFERNNVETFATWARYVQEMKREVIQYNEQVSNWLFIYTLLNSQTKRPLENCTRRKHRMDEFYKAYKDRHRSFRVLPEGGDGSEKVLLLGPRANSRTEHRYGPVWEYCKGITWQMVDPLDGTLKGDYMMRTEGVARRDEGTGMVESSVRGSLKESASAPQLPRLANSPPSSAMKRGPSKRRASKAETTNRSWVLEKLPVLTSRHRYISSCDASCSLPIATEFATGGLTIFDATNHDMCDNELLSMVPVISSTETLSRVQLFGNERLTDHSLVPLLESIIVEPRIDSLRFLCLSGLARASIRTIQTIEQVIRSAKGLIELDISRIPIPIKSQLSLCEAIGSHKKLKTVSLADTKLGDSKLTNRWSELVLHSWSIKALDISWNPISAKDFEDLGTKLAERGNSLEKLSVANCSRMPEPGMETPIAYFLEKLPADDEMKMLDLTMNRIDHTCALVLEDCLDTHENLKTLNLLDNPIGIGGMRCLLRLLCREHTGLTHFMVNPLLGKEGEEEFDVMFSYTNPGGVYNFDLSRPSHRSLLRLLYKSCGSLRILPEVAFTNIKASFSFEHCRKNSKGIYDVPTAGTLSLFYDLSFAFEKGLQGVGEQDFDEVLNKHYEAMRFTPGSSKVIPLFGMWKQLEGKGSEQRTFLKALSKDFNLKESHLQHMLRSAPLADKDIMCQLFQCIPPTSASQFLSCLTLASLGDYIWFLKEAKALLGFNPNNPTGHYALELHRPSDFIVAEKLLVLDRWEASVDRKLERKDVSARKTGSHWRNEIYERKPLTIRVRSAAEFTLPEYGLLDFDYVSSGRPPSDAKVLSDQLWDDLLIEINNSQAGPVEKVAILRSISSVIYITSMHMRQLMGFFKDANSRGEVFVIFFFRIVDIWNAKLFTVRFEDREEVRQLMNRLGYATFFPFMQPEQTVFELDLAHYDQRLCASIILNLALKESMYNIKEAKYVRADGTVDLLPLGVPRSWAFPDKVPNGGKFSCRYTCAPEYRKFKTRKELTSLYGYFDVNAEEDEVRWWTGLLEAPQDVIELLRVIMVKFKNAAAAFYNLDGPSGNGAITLRELEEGLEEWNCTRFDGEDKKKRIGNIFRYLDPGGEGTVSGDEWMVLDQLWQEVDLSIQEFVQFLCLTFGDDIGDAWDELDEDDGGELEITEWLEAVERIGYFGPARVVFDILDSTFDGSISFEEFKVLEKYKKGSNQAKVAQH